MGRARPPVEEKGRKEGGKGEKCFDCKLLHKLSRRRGEEGERHAAVEPNMVFDDGFLSDSNCEVM